MDQTVVFNVPNAHHVFGSRTGFSDSLVGEGYGNSVCIMGVLGQLMSQSALQGYGKAVCTMGVPGQLMSQMGYARKLKPYIHGLERAWQGRLHHGGVWAVDFLGPHLGDFRQTGETK